ncbi:hypothetical protein GIB67_022401 [Kingdonia uniflora]|uniref:Uncharacterized protein n=1 Tax=Kingdonia uniflora TaxID=39325 RepID=A0A7J7MTR9_9MAGN|nr:hypothetical protein GIB67_022401 [Kingdonia uniflora]
MQWPINHRRNVFTILKLSNSCRRLATLCTWTEEPAFFSSDLFCTFYDFSCFQV